MRKLPVSKQLLLTLWKFWTMFRCAWKIFLLETAVKVILIFLLSFIVREGIMVEELGPFEPIPNLLILYTPTNDITDNLIAGFADSIECPDATVEAMNTEQDLLGRWAKRMDEAPGDDDIVGIIFEIATERTLNYTVRLNDNSRIKEVLTRTIEFSRKYWKIYMKRFIAVQSVIENTFIERVSGTKTIQEYPVPYTSGLEISTIHKTVLLQRFTSWTGLFICCTFFRSIMEEKESGLKEFQNALGISSTMLWIGRLIDMVVKSTFSNIAIAFVMRYVINFNLGVLWLYLTVYSMKAASFLFFMSVFFRKLMSALIFVAILWTTAGNIGKYLILYGNEYNDKISTLAFAFVFPNVGLGLGFHSLAMLEMIEIQDVPAQQKDQEIKFVTVLALMLGSTVFFLLMTFYLDPIWEAETGGSWRPWPLKKRYRGKSGTPRGSVVDVDYVDTTAEHNFQAPPMPAHPAVRMRGVYKSYRSAAKKLTVLNNISLDFFTNEVTLVLGENGSGKSTMIKSINGVAVPDHGTVYVQSMDVRDEYDLSLVRAQIGWCPQKNIFIGCMNIKQLLTFAGKMRGLEKVDNEEQVNNLLDALAIRNVSNKKPAGCVYSIGRLVCFAFAIMGRPPIILLDEPSAGIDIEGRRLMWNVIKELRKNRVIVICTNHMDIVDEIADRAVIIKSGKVRCWGSPHYLKSTIGPSGFRLIVERPIATDINLLQRAVIHYFPQADTRPLHAVKLKFLLPRENIHRLPRLVNALRRLGVHRLSITPCTMDDVFMKITKQFRDPEKKKRRYILPTTKPCVIYERGTDVTWWDQFKALCRKEYIVMKRSWLLYLIGVIVQVCIIIAIIMVSEWRMFTRPEPLRTLTMFKYRGITLTEKEDQQQAIDLEHSYRELSREFQSKTRRTQNMDEEVEELLRENRLSFTYNYYVGARLHWHDGLRLGTPMFSNAGTFTPVVSINLLNNAILRALNHRESRISVNQHPFYQRQFTIVAERMGEGLWGELMVVVLALWLTAFGLSAFEERKTGCFMIWSLAGAHSITYWMSRFVCHITLHILLTCILLIATITGGINMFSCPSAAGTIFLIWLLYGFAAIAFIYFLTRFLISVGDVIKALIAVIVATSVFFHFTANFVVLRSLNNAILKYILMILPNYSARVALMTVYDLIIEDSPCRLQLADVCPVGFQNDTHRQRECMIPRGYVKEVFEYLVALALACVLYLTIVIWWDSKPMWLWRLHRTLKTQYMIAKNLRRGEEWDMKEDSDIMKERVFSQVAFSHMQKKPRGYRFPSPPPYMLVANEATLSFVEKELKRQGNADVGNKGKTSIRVRGGSCMGLLGADRSHRNILLYLLSGQELPSRGDVAGIACRLSEGRQRYMSNVGFVGSYDALLSQLTVLEHVQLICSLRGMHLDEFQAKWNIIFGLNTLMPRKCGSLSKGRKRLLSVALSLVGEPSVVLMDMPTVIMDPRSRRRVGSALGEYMRSNKSIVITTNCIADILTLCTHMACVHLGKILCLGTFLYLRERYRIGYAIFFDVNDVDEDLDVLRQAMRDEFAGKSRCSQVDRDRVHFYIADSEMRDDVLVQRLEKIMAQVPGVLSYVVRDRSIIHMLTEGVSQVQSKSVGKSGRATR